MHEQHTERKILRVIEDHTPEVKSEYEELANFYDPRRPAGEISKMFRKMLDKKPTSTEPRELWLSWHEENQSRRVVGNQPPRRDWKEVRVLLAQMFAEGWTIERDLRLTGTTTTTTTTDGTVTTTTTTDTFYLVLARQLPRPRPGPPAGGV